MKDAIRGIECSLYNGEIKSLLLFLSNKPFDFFAPWCMAIHDNRMLLPEAVRNQRISALDLKEIAEASIWELVLHIFPIGLRTQQIETYDDYIRSPCIGCLIFYDCGLMDIYVKDCFLREQIYNLLLTLHASDVAFITDTTDGRTDMHL